MSQHDYTIANQAFPATRADINNALSAIATNNSGTSAPSTQYAGQFWIDTTSSTWTLYIHDGSDDIQFATIDTSANTVNFIDSELGDNSVTTAKIADANVTSAKLSYPLTTFSSTGIDDNATSTAITIDSSENVDVAGKFSVRKDGVTNQVVLKNLTAGSLASPEFTDIHFLGTSSRDKSRIRSLDVNASAQVGLLRFQTSNANSTNGSSLIDRMEIANNGNISFYEDTGTTPKFFWDASTERLGIGTSSPDNPLHVVGDSTFEHRTDVEFKIQDATDTGGGTRLSSIWKGSGSDVEIGNIEIDLTDGTTGSEDSQILFKTIGNGTLAEAMRIENSGALLLNTTSSFDVGKLCITYTIANRGIAINCTSTSSSQQIAFRNPNGIVGSIATSASSTAYNTSSDYRLKENVSYDFDATTRLKQLKPARFNFIADADTTVDGFLAHEVQSVVPEAITGTHNEVEVWKEGEELPEGVSVGDNKLDENGNTIPVYQGIDQSKLVPLLVKTIQELEARITALENK